MATKKASRAAARPIVHLMLDNNTATWCGFKPAQVTRKTNDPDASTCEGCTREWANAQIQNSLATITSATDRIQGKSEPQALKDAVDMSVIVRTNFTCDGDDADTINDMYMVLVRFLKIGSGDAKLVKDGGDVLARYKSGNKK